MWEQAYGGVPASNYRTLRDTDNRYWINSSQWIDFAPSQVKVNNSNRTYLIGTDGADNFDSSYYAAYSQWINSGLLVNFLGGGGNANRGHKKRRTLRSKHGPKPGRMRCEEKLNLRTVKF